MQTLFLVSQESDPFVVLKATGELDLHTQDEFERTVTELLESSPVLVDLSELDFFAISALRCLVVCHRKAVSTGHEVFYVEPSRQLLRLLSISGLEGVLPVRSPVAPNVEVA